MKYQHYNVGGKSELATGGPENSSNKVITLRCASPTIRYRGRAHPVVGAPLAIWNLEQFEVEADFLAEHFQQIDTEAGAALIQLRVGCRVSESEK